MSKSTEVPAPPNSGWYIFNIRSIGNAPADQNVRRPDDGGLTGTLFFIRFLQGELRHGQLDGVDRAAQRVARRNPRAQSRSANIRLVQLGASGTVEVHRSTAPVEVSEKREQPYTVVFGQGLFFLPTGTHAPRRERTRNLKGTYGSCPVHFVAFRKCRL